MSDPLKYLQIPFCQIHNLPGVRINQDKNHKNQLVLCIECLAKNNIVEDQIKENFKDMQNETLRKIDKLNQFMQSIHDFQTKITKSVQEIIILVKEQINVTIKNQTILNEMFIESQFMQTYPMIQINQEQNQSFKDFNDLMAQQLKMLKEEFNIENLIESLQQNEQQIQVIQENIRKYQYSQVINCVEQQNQCYAIAINSNNSIIAAGNNKRIRIFEFLNDNLKEIQQLNGHSKTITCLIFLKKSQQLVSACDGGSIIIWQLNHQKLYEQIQILKEHTKTIFGLQINKNEDLIISGSNDKTIKFWKLDEKQWKCDQTFQMEDQVLSISLNESNNKLIASLNNKMQIKVIKKDGNQWDETTETIKLIIESLRLCFIDDEQFATQLLRNEKLQIYNYDYRDDQFKLGQEIKVKYENSDFNFFPMQYIKSKNLLIDKNSKYINVLRKQQNGEFTLDQSIDVGDRDLYGCVSDDGSYLFTWVTNQKQIQISKLEII